MTAFFVMHGFQNGQKMWNFDVGSSMGDRQERITPVISEMGWIFWDTKAEKEIIRDWVLTYTS